MRQHYGLYVFDVSWFGGPCPEAIQLPKNQVTALTALHLHHRGEATVLYSCVQKDTVCPSLLSACSDLCESESCSVVSDSLWPHGLYSPWNCPNQNTGVGSHSLLQGIFPIQGLNPCFLHCSWKLYQLSHKGSPRILEWVPYPFFSRSRPRNWTRVSCPADGFFINWAIRKAHRIQCVC